MRISLILLILVLLNFTGCGSAGNWEDDAGNWKRAYGDDLPKGIKIEHSYYWRSAHWTMEYEYFFVIADSQAARDNILKLDELKKYEKPDELRISVDSFVNKKPSWFLPKKLEAYDTWIIKDPDGRGNLRLFIDKETKEIHITDYQV